MFGTLRRWKVRGIMLSMAWETVRINLFFSACGDMSIKTDKS